MSDAPIKSRGEWTSRIGFILAATGSAIGLGNIWKFPYITGDYGGGAFVIVYLVCVLIVGLPLMLAELMIGRKTTLNPVGAFQKLHHKRSLWAGIGWRDRRLVAGLHFQIDRRLQRHDRADSGTV